jgi:hypothetical protein
MHVEVEMVVAELNRCLLCTAHISTQSKTPDSCS